MTNHDNLVSVQDERALFEAWAEENAIRTDLGALEGWMARATLVHGASTQAAQGGGVQDIGALQEQSAAWFAVCGALDDTSPNWRAQTSRGMDSAVEAIRSLAANPAPSAAPANWRTVLVELLEVVETRISGGRLKFNEEGNRRIAAARELVTGSAPSAAPAPTIKDALRRSGANTDYHGKLLFSQAEFDKFVSLIQGAAPAQVAQGEPVAWFSPNETSVQDAFLWHEQTRSGHVVPVYRAAPSAQLAEAPSHAAQPLWDDNGEPWNEAAEQADRAARQASAQEGGVA